MLSSALLPMASKIQVHTILWFSISGLKSVLQVITPGHHVSKTATRTSLLRTWSIPERKPQTGFNRATMSWQNTFSLMTINSCKRAINMWQPYVYVMNLPSKAVLEFSFLLFVCLLLHFVSSVPFLICKKLIRKEVFPVVAWNKIIANCSQSSKQ